MFTFGVFLVDSIEAALETTSSLKLIGGSFWKVVSSRANVHVIAFGGGVVCGATN